MPDTFAYCAVPDPTGTTNFRVRQAQFGDGYVQTIADGIHNIVHNWPLVFRGSAAKMAPIMAFIDAHVGAISFYWTPPAPGAVQGLYTCQTYTVQANGAGVYTVGATFQEVFHP
jgi:phage-related protein